ncbi:hypothetical protein Ddye_030665 [Dipteronia dyeriana]|uniref:Reverse transcriptase zinc-binding domain-containing protein n=1 Tax=Dipteronia dyeriana TaxID=168575 RepID=A0AAD9THT7_9ROSI|nr:hypothetical protein Ddye_030665 [Dipteronia dyeriana]
MRDWGLGKGNFPLNTHSHFPQMGFGGKGDGGFRNGNKGRGEGGGTLPRLNGPPCPSLSPSTDQVSSKLHWNGFCPPKVEIFVWTLLKDKVLVKDVLSHFGVDMASDWNYPICKDCRESMDHLFLHCSWMWKIWTRCLSW